ncbi:MAG: hypothetical protein GX799_07450 [Crenarchaeota archaeon]|jgi:hypothetical protein|nr:hypothetical protein [Thermoproteota archaeon]
MKSTCPVCTRTYRGIALSTVKGGNTVEVCPTCYKTLDAEYRKNSCIACAFFQSGTCELFGTDLDEPYVQNIKCNYYTTSRDPETIAKVKIKKLELAGRYEEAAKEYETLGLKEKAAETRRKITEKPHHPMNLDEAIGQLIQRGQTLTYFCCHCGTPLKIGAKQEVQKSCTQCNYDLSAIDVAKLISQHL